MPKIIISGTISYDNIMSCPISLKDSIIENSEWTFKLPYLVDTLHKEVWWTGLNVSYNLALLWEDSILLSSAWYDFEFSDFIKENVFLDWVLISKDKLTSRTYFTTDPLNNQITAFYPWTTEDSSVWECKNIENIEYAMIASNNVNIMLRNLRYFKNKWIKTFFSPGQQIGIMTREQLLEAFSYTDYLIVNTYNYEFLKKKAELSDGDMIISFQKLIITYGIRWSKIFDNNYNMLEIEWVENPKAIDSTWTWEAYKAWLLKWLLEWFSWEQSARLWAVLASISTWTIWAQNHKIDWQELRNLYKDTFGERIL